MVVRMKSLLARIVIVSSLLSYVPFAYSNASDSSSEEIIVWDRLQDNPVAYQILETALDKTKAEYGDYHLTPSIPMEQKRVIFQVMNSSKPFIVNFAPNEYRESVLQPIRIPVTQGLLGYRVCLIKPEKQTVFSGVKGIESLKDRSITIGQGKDWPDTKILKSNGLNVITSPKYQNLFSMLEFERFDCFARSISEVLPELEKHSLLTLEKSLLLVYRLPSFFFVNQNQTVLANRIEKGMQIAYQDGSIQKIIQQHYKGVFSEISASNRTIIHLKNHGLSKKTQDALDEFNYWLNFGELQ